MWLEQPQKAVTAGTLALLLGGTLIATGLVILNVLVG